MALVKSVYGTNYYKEIFEPILCNSGHESIFTIGDKVRLKSWEKLIEALGEPDDNGNIQLVPDMLYFPNILKPLCGKEFVIKDIYSYSFSNCTLIDIQNVYTLLTLTAGAIEHIK